MKHRRLVSLFSFFAISLCAQGADPVPFISSVTPARVSPGGVDFTLTVRGAGFISGDSKIFWNGTVLPNPTFCTPASAPAPASCHVTIPSAKIAAAGSGNITVVNGTPSKASNSVTVEIHTATPVNAVFDPDNSSARGYPGAVAIADFNNDGKPDIAAVVDTLEVLLGDGAGRFTVSFATNSIENLTAIAVGDFNQDGNLDIAVTDYNNGLVNILLGDGTGRFTQVASLTIGVDLKSIVTGDFNGDGNLDLAVGNVNNRGVQILLGNGTGQFSTGALYPTAGARLAMGDFNSDGKLDLAVATANNTVNILLGNGTGGFSQATSLAVGTKPIEIHAADLNGDGKLDLAVLNHCGSDPDCGINQGSVSVLIGDGLAHFTLASSPATGDHPASFAIGDLDGDGHPDLVVVNNDDSNSTPFSNYYDYLTILLGDGTGQFTASAPVPTSFLNNPNSAAVADFNGDGRLDFMAGFVYLQAPPGLVNSVSPASGTGNQQTFTALYSDGFAFNHHPFLTAAHNLTRVTFQMNTSFVAAGGCYVVFDQYENSTEVNRLYLNDDAHKNLLGPITPGQPGTLSNSQCTLDGAGSSVSVLYNALTLKLALTFSPTFVGQQNIYLDSFDWDERTKGWQQRGTWNSQ